MQEGEGGQLPYNLSMAPPQKNPPLSNGELRKKNVHWGNPLSAERNRKSPLRLMQKNM